jgi:SAM-dependent methyltransferase
MYIAERTLAFISAAFKSYGPSKIKKFLWDKEYSGDKWNFADNTVGDCVYRHLEQWGMKGSILDLGCGAGNTATELDATVYRLYVGVDISDTALAKAQRRTQASGRMAQNNFVCADFLSYLPTQRFNVILFRESMYHVPLGKVGEILNHYAKYLEDGGVFIVRMKTLDLDKGDSKHRPIAMLAVMETEFEVIENCQYRDFGATVIVFRPKSPTPKNTPLLTSRNIRGETC